ncbi:MAG TPA: hypothetical protein VHT25_04940 [Solirubrobacteraceae bacterium]|nr:hypothetical protein [Solirubrobacteraceae bacterium]
MLALVLAGALLTACGKGSAASSDRIATVTVQSSASSSTPKPTPSTPAPSTPAPSDASKRQARAFAQAVNLTSADVPGFAATNTKERSSSSEKRLEHEMLSCAGIAGSAKALVEESSKDFRLKRQILDLSVSSEVAVQASAAQAQKGLAAIRSAHVRGCFTRFLQQLFDGEQAKGAKAGPVTIQSGTPPAPGMSGSFGWRVTATFLVRGVKVPIYLDFLGFVDGPSQITLLSSGLLRPFPATVQHLFAELLARARSHKP